MAIVEYVGNYISALDAFIVLLTVCGIFYGIRRGILNRTEGAVLATEKKIKEAEDRIDKRLKDFKDNITDQYGKIDSLLEKVARIQGRLDMEDG